ncbi:hypothetical protein MRB53_031746 [Persea americana]|uniref:Uncharacterized protein n=1 Tax=Persea americana TaxID=3435 RepID=A0ACC2KPZ7_PERAE|nr:hypothetical protein MRB53_031746 [Persea americana]
MGKEGDGNGLRNQRRVEIEDLVSNSDLICKPQQESLHRQTGDGNNYCGPNITDLTIMSLDMASRNTAQFFTQKKTNARCTMKGALNSGESLAPTRF